MIDHATINLISRFASRTHLTADLSHTNQDAGAGSRQHDNVAIGNYHYGSILPKSLHKWPFG